MDERELDGEVARRVGLLLKSGPEALSTCKRLLERVPTLGFEEAKTFTAEMIARLRISEEGQEGMNAFLSKRLPEWVGGESRDP